MIRTPTRLPALLAPDSSLRISAAVIAVLACTWVAPAAHASNSTPSPNPVVVAAGVDFKQPANLGPPTGKLLWTAGTLQQSNSLYVEGLSVAQRLTLVSIAPAAGNQHTLRIAHQSTASGGLHAYDFLTSWDQATQAAEGKGPGGANLLDELADPAAICGPNISPPVTLEICEALWQPDENPVIAQADLPDLLPAVGGGASNVQAQIAQYEAALGNRLITLRAPEGSTLSNVSVVFMGYSGGADNLAFYDVRWTSGSTTIGIELAGHLAAGAGDGIVSGYGAGFGSSTISAGSYHFRVTQLDGVSLVSLNLDNQIKAADIDTVPPTCELLGPDNACQGQTGLSFSDGASFDPTITYAWSLVNNTAGASLASANGSNQITVNAGGGAGSFTLQLSKTNAGGTTTCSHAVTVNPATAASALDDQEACPGQDVVFTTTASGTGPFTFSWTKDGVVIPGATGPQLTLPAVDASLSGEYCVTVTGACGSDTACAALTVKSATIATDPPDQTACSGDSVSFTTTALGTGPFVYVWTFNGNPIGTNLPTLNLGAVDEADEGTYCVAVTGACGLPVERCAALVVNAPTSTTDPLDQTVCPGTPVILKTVTSGTGPFTFSWTKDGAPIPGATTFRLDLGVADPGDQGTYCVTATGQCGSASQCTTLSVSNALTTSDPPDRSVCEGDVVSIGTVSIGAGPVSYAWTKNGTLIPGATNATLDLGVVDASDAAVYCVTASNSCASASQCMTLHVFAPVTVVVSAGLVACPGTPVSLPSSVSGTGPFTYQWSKDGVPIPGGTTSTLNLGLVDAADEGSYCVAVTGTCSSDSACCTLTVNSATTTTDPLDQAACAGSPVSFTTVTTGVGPFTHQWKQNGVVIPGAVTVTLSLGPVDASDAGTYTVEATGGCGSTVGTATLTVLDGVTLERLSDVAVTEGTASVVLGPAVALGTPPFAYQWFHDGIALAGANGETLTVTGPLSATTAGEYCVEVGDANGCAPVSGCLTLSIAEPAAVARHPGSVGIFPVHRSGKSGGHVTHGGGSLFFTIVSVTNTDTQPTTPQGFGGATNLHYEYVNVTANTVNPFLPSACTIFDRVEYLTPADTRSVLTSCHNAVAPQGQQGYLVVSAQDPAQFDVDWSHNHLIGSEIVINGSGGMYSIGMVSVPSPLPDKAPTDLPVAGGQPNGNLDFDGNEYALLPEQVYMDSFVALGDSRLALLNLTGGLAARNTLKIQAWNDNEFPLSATRTFACWFDEPLEVVSPLFSNSFLAQNTPDDPAELDLDCNGTGDIETAWARIDSIDVSHPFGSQIAADGVVLGALTSGPSSLVDGGTLLWESQATQNNGAFGSP